LWKSRLALCINKCKILNPAISHRQAWQGKRSGTQECMPIVWSISSLEEQTPPQLHAAALLLPGCGTTRVDAPHPFVHLYKTKKSITYSCFFIPILSKGGKMHEQFFEI